MITTTSLRRALLPFVIAIMFLVIAPNVPAQNVASQKAYFGSGTTEIVGPSGDMVLYGQIKTSNVGDLLIGFSMECALWTTTSNSAKKGGGKTTSTSRAAVNVTVHVDGNEAEPGKVVYCDRKQTVNLTFASETEVVTDFITLEIFQETKNANHFNFYYENPGSEVHLVEIFVDSVVETSDDSPQVVLENTRAAIGKRSLVIQEYNNP
jgi:hypothetical protein